MGCPIGKWLFVMVVFWGCSDTPRAPEKVGTVSAALSSNEIVLGFEDPLNDWSSDGFLSESSIASQGSKALGITLSGWTVTSTGPLPSLGQVGNNVSYDIRFDQELPWGETRLIVVLESENIWYQEVGSANLAGLAPNQFHRIEFPLGNLQSPLSGTYSDLFLRVVINAPQGNYVIDNLDFGLTSGSGGQGGTAGTGGQAGSGGTGGTGGETTTDELEVRLPLGLNFDEVALSAQGAPLILNDGVKVTSLEGNGFASITKVEADAQPSTLGVSAETGDLHTEADAWLRNYALVHGSVRTAGIIDKQAGADVEGDEILGAQLDPYEIYRVQYLFPSTPQQSQTIQNGLTVSFTPGPNGRFSAGEVRVQAQSTLELDGAGSYYFDQLSIEPDNNLVIDNAAGPIYVFVRDWFNMVGNLVKTDPSQFNVLFGVVGDVTINAPFTGTLIAPNADLTLPSKSQGHEGSFHARSITVHQWTEIRHRPFEASLCPPEFGENCGPVQQCDPSTPDLTPCEEPLGCEGQKLCLGGECQCRDSEQDDDNTCTEDTCVGNDCFHRPWPLGTPCTDFFASCEGSTVCDGQARCSCRVDASDDDFPEQDDGNLCTDDLPDPQIEGFLHVPRARGAACENGAPFTCNATEACDGKGQCICVSELEAPDDGNSCTRDECDDTGCSHWPRPITTECVGGGFCNGTCDLTANCICDDVTPASEGVPLRVGTFNTAFLANFVGAFGNGFAGCSQNFFGDTDFRCNVAKLAPKIIASQYDVLVLNEVFDDIPRNELVAALKGDGPGQFPHVVEQLDGGSLFEALQDSGLMLFSKLPFDTMTSFDEFCLEGHLDNQTAGAGDDDAVAFVGYDEAADVDDWAKKGVGWARLVSPTGLKYNVFFTHMQSSYARQKYADWRDKGILTRAQQFEQMAEVASCISNPPTGPTPITVFAGDMNVNGDLSNPFFEIDGPELAVTCQNFNSPSCATLLAEGVYDPVTDTCDDPVPRSQPLPRVCFNEVPSKTRRLNSRTEWDSVFLADPQPDRPPHPFHNLGLTDTWAYSMTPQCVPSSYSAPVTEECRAEPTDPSSDPERLKGEAMFDRGLTSARQASEERLDYIFLNSDSDPMCAQHVTLAWNLLHGVSDAYEGGITPTMPGVNLAGTDHLSDHFGLNAELNKLAEYCNPGSAYVAPEIPAPKTLTSGETFESDGTRALPLRLPYRGAVHWIRIDQPGTWTFNVNPLFQKPFSGEPFDNGITHKVYEKTDLSRPMRPVKGETLEVPTHEACFDRDIYGNGIDCREIPGFKDAKFHVPEPPLYVKVYHPGNEYPDDWHGQYLFIYKRAVCTSSGEACIIAPFEGTNLDRQNNVLELAPDALRTYPQNFGDALWYAFYVDAPDHGLPQTLKIVLTEDNPVAGASQVDHVDIVAADMTTQVAQLQPQGPNADGKYEWVFEDSSGILDLQGNPSGSTQKYFIKVQRLVSGTLDPFDFWLHWETNLTWLYGPAYEGGEAATIACSETQDWMSHDELYMQFVVDGVRHPAGADGAEAQTGAILDTDFTEDDEIEWTQTVFPQLGQNQHGTPYAKQRAFKYVENVQLVLLEDDGGLNFDDDVSSATIATKEQTLAPSRSTQVQWTFGGEAQYNLIGGSWSHWQPSKACETAADCSEPLLCRGGFCMTPL